MRSATRRTVGVLGCAAVLGLGLGGPAGATTLASGAPSAPAPPTSANPPPPPPRAPGAESPLPRQ
ncbi:hypothetical protein [Mycobacterium sp. E3198]|uniref:hypothetical protein n=1 Tax=Mycobacterium sp. E3198 TaxID=1834143 RepID=UPI000A496902|nr:hypothetical protein [Mycobacterium sp. E3198]